MGNVPGHYCIKFDDDIPNVHICQGSGLENLDFDAIAGDESTFAFEIVESEVRFSETPITWLTVDQEQPPSVHSEIGPENKVLSIRVTPPDTQTSEHQFHFRMNFDNDTSLGPPLDPTIVEKPPQTPPDDQE